MVSKLNILQNYYHIPLEDQFTFTYDSHKYYLTNKPFPFYYQKYISLLQINPFKIIDNIYQQKQSQGFILYQLLNIPTDIQKNYFYLSYSARSQNNKRYKKRMDSILRIHSNPYVLKFFRIPNHLLHPFYPLSAVYRTFKSLFYFFYNNTL